LSSEIRGTDQAIRNAMDSQALIDTAEGAHKEIENILQRMREVSVQAANDTNDLSDRSNLQAEMNALMIEIDRIASVTTWAGQSLMSNSGSTSDFSFQVGTATGSKNQITVKINDMSTDTTVANGGIGMTLASGNSTAATVGTGSNASVSTSSQIDTITFTGASTVVVGGFTSSSSASATVHAKAINESTTAVAAGVRATVTSDGKLVINRDTHKGHMLSSAGARASVTNIDAAIKAVNTQRSELGAVSNRLSHTVNNLTNISANLSAAKGGIEDADFAVETTDLAKNQILQQASTAMLAQANAAKQNVLSLLQG
jgi:flagellin